LELLQHKDHKLQELVRKLVLVRMLELRRSSWKLH
jgi:hypothetical protein